METLVELLEQAAARYGDRPALAIEAAPGAETWSYRRLWRAAHAVARYLRAEQGIQRGERLLAWAPNSPRLVAAYFGCMLAGIVLVPLDAHSAPDFVARIAQRSQPTAILVGAGQEPLRQAQEEPPAPGLRAISLADLPFDAEGPALSTAEGPLLEERPRPEDVLEIVFTSGTTGDPKGVILTHGNVVANVGSLSGLIPRGPHYRLLSLLPLSHMFEQTAGLFLPLSYGATIYYTPSRLPTAIFRALGQHRITCMLVVPQVLDLFLKGIEREVRQRGRERRWQQAHRLAPRLPLPLRRLLFRDVHRSLGGSLDFFMCGGAYLPPPLAETWERLGVKVVQGYGATECSPAVTCNALRKRVLASVGRPLRNLELRLAADGEVQVRGPAVFSGYWQNEEATRAAFTDDGWYRSGDLGLLDKDGYLYLKGRKKDLIVLANGMNVYPEDVENVLSQEEAIRDCVVLGLREGPQARAGRVEMDDSGDVDVHAVILPAVQGEAPEVRSQLEAALRRANARLAPHQRIKGHSLWPGDDFPRTNTLKVKRAEVEAYLRRGDGGSRAPTAPPQAADEPSLRLRRLLSRVSKTPPEAIGPDSDLSLDLSLDSLARVELAVLLEEELGIAIDEGALAGVETVAQLQELVAGGQAPAVARAPPLPRWARKLPARLARYALQGALLAPLHRLLCRPFRVEGQERLAGLGTPLLFIANHSSHLDTPSVLRALPGRLRRRLAVAAAADYFYRDRRLGFAVSLLLNTFPFSRESSVRASLGYCAELAGAGWSVLIYPEGTRSVTGRLQPFKGGIGLLAKQLGVPVVLVAIDGTHRALPKGRSRPRPGPVTVRIGPPVEVPPEGDPMELTRLLQEALARLLPPSSQPSPETAA